MSRIYYSSDLEKSFTKSYPGRYIVSETPLRRFSIIIIIL